MFKITGIDELQKTLSDAQKAAGELEEQLGYVSFDPNDPASIEAAIQEIESMIDERLGPYSENAIIGPLADQMKETYRKGIIDSAAKARLKGGNSDD